MYHIYRIQKQNQIQIENICITSYGLWCLWKNETLGLLPDYSSAQLIICFLPVTFLSNPLLWVTWDGVLQKTAPSRSNFKDQSQMSQKKGSHIPCISFSRFSTQNIFVSTSFLEYMVNFRKHFLRFFGSPYSKLVIIKYLGIHIFLNVAFCLYLFNYFVYSLSIIWSQYTNKSPRHDDNI